MLDPAQIQTKALRQYPAFLSSLITQDVFFPLSFPVGARPKDFIALRQAVTQLIDGSKAQIGYGYQVALVTKKTQKYGVQSLPQRIYIESEEDYLKLLKKVTEVRQFKKNVALIQVQYPELTDWLSQNPRQVIEYGDRWPDLLKVCHYFKHNPKPNLYIRELPIPVHTKFIEQHQKILRSLLEAILPEEDLVSVEHEKDHRFEKRFSLKYRQPLIRIRFLDLTLQQKYYFPVSDLSVPHSEFAQLNLASHRCLITENLMPFLTLPSLSDSFALFGSGYAIQLLQGVAWLSTCPIYYWGDLDLDGFKILSQLRSQFPQTQSILMDQATFEAFQDFVVSDTAAAIAPLAHLTLAEQQLCDRLMQWQQRLEQERISQAYANQILGAIARPN